MPAEARPWPRRWLYGLLVVWWIAVAAALPNHPTQEQEFVGAFMLAYALFFLARLVFAHSQEETGRAWLLHVAVLVTSPAWAWGLMQILLATLPDPYHMR